MTSAKSMKMAAESSAIAKRYAAVVVKSGSSDLDRSTRERDFSNEKK